MKSNDYNFEGEQSCNGTGLDIILLHVLIFIIPSLNKTANYIHKTQVAFINLHVFVISACVKYIQTKMINDVIIEFEYLRFLGLEITNIKS